MMRKKEYTMYTKAQFMQIYRDMASDKSLLTALVEMQTRNSTSEQKAFEVASALIGEVAKFEYTKDMMMDAPMDVIDDFLRSAKNLHGYDRKVLLHELNFGLGLYQDPELLEQMKEGATADQLFRAYYATYGEEPALTEEVLETSIRQKLAQFRVSPTVMRTMAKKLEKSKNIMFTSAELGKESQRFKCIVAMDQYLHNENVTTMADAVNIACTHMEVEAVADAVSRGQLATRTAFRIILALGLTALVLGGLATLSIHLAPSAVNAIVGDSTWRVLNSAFGFATTPDGLTFLELGAGTGAVVLKKNLKTMGLRLITGGVGVASLSNYAAKLVGKLIAKGRFLYGRDSTAVVNGFNRLADSAEAEEQADNRQAFEEEPVEAAALPQDAEVSVF